MAKQVIKTISRIEAILAAAKAPCGTFPGANRSRKFKNRKKQANKTACRGKVNY